MERWKLNNSAGMRLSELISALSHALDMTEGQPPGHCMRCCWIGMHLADQLELDERARWELYYQICAESPLLPVRGCRAQPAQPV